MKIVNGRQYEWADVTFIIGGRDVTGFQAISYKESLEKTVIYGKGNKPQSIQSGNFAFDGSVTFLQDEVENLIAACGKKNLLRCSFDAVVSYGNPANGDMMITDKIFGLQFQELPKEMNQGDPNMKVTMPFVALDIKYQQ